MVILLVNVMNMVFWPSICVMFVLNVSASPHDDPQYEHVRVIVGLYPLEHVVTHS